MTHNGKEYSEVYDVQLAEKEFKDLLRDNPVNVILLGDLNQQDAPVSRTLVDVVIRNSYARQQHDIKNEQSRLTILKGRSHVPLSSLCQHPVRDEFHNLDWSEFRCLVCDHTEVHEQKTMEDT